MSWLAVFLGSFAGSYVARVYWPQLRHRLGYRQYVIDVTEGMPTIPGGVARGDARVVTDAPPVVLDIFRVVAVRVAQDDLRAMRVSVDLPR